MYVDLKIEKNRAHPPSPCSWRATSGWIATKAGSANCRTLITMHLEHTLTKEQIFEDYCNMVYLGGAWTFGIHGFGEAAQAYFNKDIRKSEPDRSRHAGRIDPAPSYFNPFRYPDRAVDRRKRC